MLSLQQLAQQMAPNIWFKNPFKIQKPIKHRPVNGLGGDAKKMYAWARHHYLLNNLPVSVDKLASLEMGDLRLIASIFKAYDYETMVSYDKPMLIQFIAGVQQDINQYLPLDPLPFGSFPILE